MLRILFIPSKRKFEESLNPHSLSNYFICFCTKWDNKCAYGSRKPAETLGYTRHLGKLSFVCRVSVIPWIIPIEPEPHLNLKFFLLKALCLVAISWHRRHCELPT